MSKPPTPAEAKQRVQQAGAAEDDKAAAFMALHGQLTGAELLDQIHAVLVKYVIFPRDEDADAVALWIAATHAQPAWECAARLQIRSPLKRCGKSRLLDLVEALCYSPLLMVLASPAALFRSIDADEPPSLLLDEADTIFGTKEKSETQEAIRGILNAGHQRGRTIPRCVPPMQEVRHFPTFAMAGLAGIGSLPDTIEDRSVIIELHRKAPGETVAKLRWRRVKPGLHQLRDQLHAWARANLDGLREADPELPVDDRAADTWEPLAAIADMAGEAWPERARKACRVLTGAAGNERETNLGVAVLGDLRDIFAAHDPADKAHTDALLGDLHKVDEAPWANYYGHPLDARDLAKLLKPYGVTSRTVNIDAVRKKGYYVADLWPNWERYLAPPAEEKRVTKPARQPTLEESDPPVTWSPSLQGADTSDTGDTLSSDLGKGSVPLDVERDTSDTGVSQVSESVGEHLTSDLGSVAGVAGVATPKSDGTTDPLSNPPPPVSDDPSREAPADLDDSQALGNWSPAVPPPDAAPECRRARCHEPAEPRIDHCHKHHADWECTR